MNNQLISEHMLYNQICNLYDFMGRDKKPSKERVKLIFEKLYKVRAKDLIEAISYMKDNLDNLPYNMSKAIKAAIFSMKKAEPQPEQPEFGAFGPCSDCNGSGAFNVRVFEGGAWCDCIKFCSQCENWRVWVNDPRDRVSAAELSATGTIFKPYNRVLYQDNNQRPAPGQDIKKQADSAIKPLPA